MVPKDQTECVVRGNMAIVLHLSRIYGVAPLKLESCRNGYIARISKPWIVYSSLLFAFINVVTVLGLYIDIQYLGTDLAVKVKSTSSLIVWLIDIMMGLLIVICGVWQGGARMERTMKLLNNTMKVQECIQRNRKERSNEKLTAVAVIVLFIASNLLMAMDFSAYYLESRGLKKEIAIVYTMGVHYSEYVVALLLVLQVAFAIGSIQSGFKTINDALQELIDTPKFQSVLIPSSINFISTVDSDKIRNEKVLRSLDYLTGGVGKYIRELAVSYNSLCNDVETCNVDNGYMIIIMLASFTMYLLVSSYYLVMIYCLPDTLHLNIFYACLQLMWCLFRFTKIFILIESCHRTHEEMSKTPYLLNKVMYRLTKLGQPIPSEVDIFYKQLVLYKPTFSPLSVYTLHRSQIAAISAGMITYLTIIIQYRVVDECKRHY